LWKACHPQLSGFAVDLTRTQESRETAKHTADCEAAKAARLADVERRLRSASERADAHRHTFSTAQSELDRLRAFWHYFERRRRNKVLVTLRQAMVVADGEVSGLHAERSATADEPLPEFAGISLGARRNINLAIISYAELLCEQVDAFGLAAKAKEAVARRVHEMSFGSRSDCEDYMQRVQKAHGVVANQKQITAILKVKLERLRSNCQYRNAADTVPTADSLAPPPAGGWNVLAEDYWDLYTVLLR
jgi:hypothetical protein